MSAIRKESIRLFENDFLEALTHVHPLVPLLFWSPFLLWLFWSALFEQQLSLGFILALAPAGILTWTLTEYLAHRFLFHYEARSRLGRWLVFMFHGVHHEVPNDKTRLVMPPAGAVILMTLFWILFRSLVVDPWFTPFFAFFVIGYLVYDYIHYATHHFPMHSAVAAYLKRNHMLHHFSGKTGRYGVSSPLWDIVFRTQT